MSSTPASRNAALACPAMISARSHWLRAIATGDRSHSTSAMIGCRPISSPALTASCRDTSPPSRSPQRTRAIPCRSGAAGASCPAMTSRSRLAAGRRLCHCVSDGPNSPPLSTPGMRDRLGVKAPPEEGVVLLRAGGNCVGVRRGGKEAPGVSRNQEHESRRRRGSLGEPAPEGEARHHRQGRHADAAGAGSCT